MVLVTGRLKTHAETFRLKLDTPCVRLNTNEYPRNRIFIKIDMYYLYIGSVSLIIFIISLIAGKKKRTLSDYILMAWLFVCLINAFTLILLWQDGYTPKSAAERVLYELSEASIFAHGPFFWFYTLSLT